MAAKWPLIGSSHRRRENFLEHLIDAFGFDSLSPLGLTCSRNTTARLPSTSTTANTPLTGVGVALAAAGFTVVELETEDLWMRSNPAIIELLKEVNLSTENRGDNIFALARKSGAPIERYPKELYVD